MIENIAGSAIMDSIVLNTILILSLLANNKTILTKYARNIE